MDNKKHFNRGTAILLGGRKIEVKINYEENYFLCPFCGNPIIFRKRNERSKKPAAIIPQCNNCGEKFIGIALE